MAAGGPTQRALLAPWEGPYGLPCDDVVRDAVRLGVQVGGADGGFALHRIVLWRREGGRGEGEQRAVSYVSKMSDLKVQVRIKAAKEADKDKYTR